MKVKLWTGGFTHEPSVDPPWSLKFVSVLAIISTVGALLYAVAVTLLMGDVTSVTTENAIYVAVLHFLVPVGIVYSVTTNNPISRFLILGYIAALCTSTVLGKGFLGNIDIDASIRQTLAAFAFVLVAIWLFGSKKMRFYYALIRGVDVPEDLAPYAAKFMDQSKINPRVRRVIDWFADHLETIVLIGFAILALYAYVSTGG